MTPDRADGFPDDRIFCTQCQSCDPARNHCRAMRTSTIVSLPRRCIYFTPLRSEGDQRRGGERWPTLIRDIAEARQLDQDFNKRR
jgi:hypothetical protein